MLTTNEIILGLKKLSAGSTNLRFLMETREKSLFNLFLRQETGNLKAFAKDTSEFLKDLLKRGNSTFSMQEVTICFKK